MSGLRKGLHKRGRRVKRNKRMILTEGNKGKKGVLKIILSENLKIT